MVCSAVRPIPHSKFLPTGFDNEVGSFLFDFDFVFLFVIFVVVVLSLIGC